MGLYRQAGDAGRAALFETLYADLCLGYARQVMPCRCPPMQHFQVPACCWCVKSDEHPLVPLHERAIAAITHWQKLAGAYSGGVPSPWLFHSVRNGTKALTHQAGLLKIKEAAVAAGLSSPQRMLPHVLRHAFATHMHSGGTDLRVLQELLGHAGIETTQIYTHLDTSRLHQMVRELHPFNEERRQPSERWSDTSSP